MVSRASSLISPVGHRRIGGTLHGRRRIHLLRLCRCQQRKCTFGRHEWRPRARLGAAIGRRLHIMCGLPCKYHQVMGSKTTLRPRPQLSPQHKSIGAIGCLYKGEGQMPAIENLFTLGNDMYGPLSGLDALLKQKVHLAAQHLGRNFGVPAPSFLDGNNP